MRHDKLDLKSVSSLSNTKMRIQNKNNRQDGFTLIELLVYISLAGIFLTGAIMFSWDILYGRVKNEVYGDVNHNLRIITKRITNEIRGAEGINSIGGSSLSLIMSDNDRSPTEFSLDNGIVKIGWGSTGDCPVSNPCGLSSSELVVSNLNFSEMTDGEFSNINYEVTVESQGDRQEWQRSQSYQGSVSLRR